jgi:hypothetical protein
LQQCQWRNFGFFCYSKQRHSEVASSLAILHGLQEVTVNNIVFSRRNVYIKAVELIKNSDSLINVEVGVVD